MKVLRDFPENGVCWYPSKELLQFLKDRKSNQSGHSTTTRELENRGLAWNSTGIWLVAHKSNQPEYLIEELIPFFPKPKEVAMRPLTYEECYFPYKWYIDVTTENEHLVQEFLIWKQNEYVNYRASWIPTAGCRFYYPQHDSGGYGTTGAGSKVNGYTEITTKQLVTHVLTEKKQTSNVKTQENGKQESNTEALKIRSSYLSIREGDPIRATTVRCPNSKIKG